MKDYKALEAPAAGSPKRTQPKVPERLCEACNLRPAVCAVGKGGITGSVQLCRECWALDWGDTSDDGRDDV